MIESIYDPSDRGPQMGLRGFGLPHFKGSKSSSSSSQKTINKDGSAVVEDAGINATDGAVAGRDSSTVLGARGNLNAQQAQLAVGGGLSNYKGTQNVTVQSVDSEVISTALDFGTEALDTVTGTVSEAFSFGRASLDFVDKSNEQTATVINASTEGIRQLSNKVIDSVLEDNASQRESASEALLDSVGKYSTVIILGVAAVGAYVATKKSA